MPAALSAEHDLVGIEVVRIEDGWVFVAMAPLAVGEGVDGEVEERVGFELGVLDLAGRGERAIGRGW